MDADQEVYETYLEEKEVETEEEVEETIEKEVSKDIVKEVKIPQAKALYPYSGSAISIAKGEVSYYRRLHSVPAVDIISFVAVVVVIVVVVVSVIAVVGNHEREWIIWDGSYAPHVLIKDSINGTTVNKAHAVNDDQLNPGYIYIPVCFSNYCVIFFRRLFTFWLNQIKIGGMLGILY